MSSMEKHNVRQWIGVLEKVEPKSTSSKVAKRILRLTSLPKRRRVTVNLDKLNVHAKANENIIVPGKILGTGTVDKAFTVAAVDWSDSTEKKLRHAGCKVIGLEEMLKQKDVRIIM